MRHGLIVRLVPVILPREAQCQLIQRVFFCSMASHNKQGRTNSSQGLASLAGLSSSALVYSTDVGTTCSHCRQALSACVCADPTALLGDGQVRVVLEKRKGKVVTVVTGLALSAVDIAATGKALRQACGSGGTSKDAAIEVQGDQVQKCAQWLRAKGFNVVQPKP